MRAILRIVKLDFYTLKEQFSTYWILPVVILIFSAMSSSIVVLSITAAWFILIVNTNIFAIQEKNGLERLYASLPIRQSHIVLGRYVFTIINFLLSYLIALVAGIVTSIAYSREFLMADTIKGFCLAFLLFSVISAMQLPIYIKAGYTKGKMLSLIPFVAVIGLLFISSFVDGFSSIINSALVHTGFTSVASLVIGVVATIISYYVSVQCYKKKR